MTLTRSMVWTAVLGWGIAWGDDAVGPPAPPTARDVSPGGSPRQIIDQPLEPFVPKQPMTEEEQARQEALSWYLTGQLREGRNDYEGALEAYRKAITVAPSELKPYQSLVTITFAKGERDAAVKYALQATRQSREGLPLARGLAGLLVRESQTERAIDLLEEVRKSPPADMRPIDDLILHRELGLFNRLLLKIDAAVAHYKKVMSALQDPDSPLTAEDREQLLGDAAKTYEEMGKVFLEAKLADLAVQAFDEANNYSESRPGLHSFNLATVYKETGRVEEALAELQKYFDAQLQSKGREAYQLLADLLKELGKPEELLPRLEKLHDVDSRNKPLSYFLAEQYEQQGHLDEAETLLKETLGRSNDPRGLVGLASVYHRQHRGKPLLETYAKVFQIVPQTEDAQVMERMDSELRSVVERFSELETEITEDAEAMNALVEYGREQAGEDQPDLDFAQVYVLGKLSATAERIDAAEQFYRLAIDMQNDPAAQLFLELGLALIDAERYKSASELFQQAVEHPSPKLQAAGIRSTFLYLQSHALEMDGQTDEALRAIGEARQSMPDNPRFHFQEAWVYYHAHRWDEAIQKFEEVIRDHQGADDEESKQYVRSARFSLSAVYVQLEDFEKGEEVLMVVLEQEPDHPQVNNSRAFA